MHIAIALAHRGKQEALGCQPVPKARQHVLPPPRPLHVGGACRPVCSRELDSSLTVLILQGGNRVLKLFNLLIMRRGHDAGKRRPSVLEDCECLRELLANVVHLHAHQCIAAALPKELCFKLHVKTVIIKHAPVLTAGNYVKLYGIAARGK